MATTTNYGWTTPDDTALVKDGASAIRTLGTSVDTTTKNLNPETTLGDIAYRSSTSNVNTRLGIGTTGQVLSVSGGVPVWATSSSGGMTLISTTTLTGASVTLSSIPSTYKNLQLVVKNLLPDTDTAALNARVNGDSGANRYSTVSWAGSSGATASFGSSAWTNFFANMDNAVAQNLCVVNIFDYANATTWKLASTVGLNNDATTTTSYVRNAGNLFYNQTPAISSITLFMDVGNFTSGTALLYGVS